MRTMIQHLKFRLTQFYLIYSISFILFSVFKANIGDRAYLQTLNEV
jgi:hypothetical protein